MSASLVGSEMCIRDRSPPRSSRLRWRLLPVSRIRPRARLLLLPPTSPVSYTHLTLPTICSV
eukprot:7140068-Alexandrium_andersonii.AAC.1